MKINLHKNYPIIHQEQGLSFMANGHVVIGYRLSLPEIYSLSQADFDKLHAHWVQALKGLPTKTVVHKQDIYLKKQYNEQELEENTFLSRATRRYFAGRDYLSHQSYVFFTWPGRSPGAGLANPFSRYPLKIPQQLGHELEVFCQAVRDGVSYLNNTRKLDLEPLSPKAMVELTDAYFNGFTPDADTDLLMEPGGIRAGERLFQVLAINHEQCFGDQVATCRPNPTFTQGDRIFHQGLIDPLGLGIPQDHVVNQLLVLDDRSRWLGILNQRREELKKSVNFGSTNRVILEQIEDLLSRISRDDQARMIRGQVSLIYGGRTPEETTRTGSVIKGILKELDIRPYQPAGRQLHHYFLHGYFGFAPGFSGQDLYVGELRQALCLWINNSNYRSDAQGVLFNDRLYNLPVRKDVWDADKKRIKARNFAIFAPTGEGKSFLANNILRQFYEAGTRLVIIDLGGSYAKFARLYPRDHIILRYQQGKNLGINPFYIHHPEDLSPDRIEDLTAFLLELTASGTRPGKHREVALKKILLAYYRQTPGPYSLEGFYSYVAENHQSFEKTLGISREFFNPRDFLHILSEYVPGGMYSFLFEAGEDQVFRLEDKRMIIFELDQVRDNREILSVMLKLIKSAIQRTIWRNRSQRGVILFDEFAKQLKFENVLESVEFYYQAIRKQNGAIGIILQSINQLPENATSASILENTQVIYSLHNEKGYGDLQRRLHLSAHDLNQLHSLRNQLRGSRRYTEVFIKLGRESNVYRLEVPPEVYAAYLTDGHQSELLDTYYEKTGSMEAAIQQFLKTKEL